MTIKYYITQPVPEIETPDPPVINDPGPIDPGTPMTPEDIVAAISGYLGYDYWKLNSDSADEISFDPENITSNANNVQSVIEEIFERISNLTIGGISPEQIVEAINEVLEGTQWQIGGIQGPIEVVDGHAVIFDGTTGQLVKSAEAAPSLVGHTHVIGDITDLSSELSGKANTVHDHTISDVTGLSDALSGKANTVHGHDISDIDGLSSALSNKSDTGHGHAISDITDLGTTLNSKVSDSRTISTSGMASGGGDLTENRTITVSKVTAAQFREKTNDDAALTTKQVVDAAEPIVLTPGATITINMANGYNYSAILDQNTTLANPTGAVPGISGIIHIQANSHSLAVGSSWKFPNGVAPSIAGNSSIAYSVWASNYIVCSFLRDVK